MKNVSFLAPRENIFATYYSRSAKSCPSPAVRPLAKIEKKATYYNDSCYSGPPKQKYPDQVRVNTHVTHFDRQCHSSSVKHDQNNFAAPDPNQPPVYSILEGKARVQPAQDPKYPIRAIHEDKACPYDSSRSVTKQQKAKSYPKKAKILSL
jgi:hypothetical protein